MRLGQLARKLAIHPSEIVSFLAKSNIAVTEQYNTKLDDDHVTLVIQKFAPILLEQNEAIAEYLVDEKIEIEEEPTTQPEEIEIEVENIPASMPLSVVDAEELKDETAEVIKTAKVELPGLKVIGKIELPEPKKKEAMPEENASIVEEPVASEKENKPSVQRSRAPYSDKKARPTNRPSINPIALQRELDARDAEQKRRENAIKEKEKRTEYYRKKVKVNAPTKAAKLYAEPLEHYSVDHREVPKTWIGKFFRWLTTA